MEEMSDPEIDDAGKYLIIAKVVRRIAGETSKRRGCINSRNANRTLCTNIQRKHTTRRLVRFLRSSWFFVSCDFPMIPLQGVGSISVSRCISFEIRLLYRSLNTGKKEIRKVYSTLKT